MRRRRGRCVPASGISSPASPSGYPAPSIRSWLQRAIWQTNGCSSTADRICSEITGCSFITTHSSSFSGAGLWRMRSGIAILPMSWSSAPISTASRSSPVVAEPLRERQRERGDALGVPARVVVLRLHRAGQRRDRVAVRLPHLLGERPQRRVRRPPARVRAADLGPPPRGAVEVLAQREEQQRRRQREGEQPEQPELCVGDAEGERERPEDEIVRGQPAEPLAPDGGERQALGERHRPDDEAEIGGGEGPARKTGEPERAGARRAAAAERGKTAARPRPTARTSPG